MKTQKKAKSLRQLRAAWAHAQAGDAARGRVYEQLQRQLPEYAGRLTAIITTSPTEEVALAIAYSELPQLFQTR